MRMAGTPWTITARRTFSSFATNWMGENPLTAFPTAI